jgi:hypothetical protein
MVKGRKQKAESRKHKAESRKHCVIAGLTRNLIGFWPEFNSGLNFELFIILIFI